jgi:site-specific DNA-adenine methylase
MQSVFNVKKQELKTLLKNKINDDLVDVVNKITDYNALLNVIMFTKNMKSKNKKDYIDIIEFYLEGQPKPDKLNKK